MTYNKFFVTKNSGHRIKTDDLRGIIMNKVEMFKKAVPLSDIITLVKNELLKEHVFCPNILVPTIENALTWAIFESLTTEEHKLIDWSPDDSH